MADDKQAALRELKVIPGVGKAIAEDLWSLGIRRVNDLKGRDPQALYDNRWGQTRLIHHGFPCLPDFLSPPLGNPRKK